MYELRKKKIGKVLTSKSLGTWPSSYEKRIYRATVSQRLRNTGTAHHKFFNLCVTVVTINALMLDLLHKLGFKLQQLLCHEYGLVQIYNFTSINCNSYIYSISICLCNRKLRLIMILKRHASKRGCVLAMVKSVPMLPKSVFLNLCETTAR